MESNIEKAGKYLEASKMNRENLWKRRQIEWKTSFSLWTAIAVTSGFIYIYEIKPDSCLVKWIFLIVVLIVYITIIWLQKRHIRAIFISNERDLDFMIYYTNRAAWELNRNDFDEKPKRPEWSKKTIEERISEEEENEYYNNRKRKMRHHYTIIMTTGLIALLSWCILAIMCFKI
jgi:hypothetical protein